ncbi:MAG: PepSY domain-containing protein [Bacteroidota bacterium]
MKNSNLNKWMWKWHIIAGLISLPIVLLLSVTGFIYLLKEPYEAPQKETLKKVLAEGERLSYQEQWELAKTHAVKPPSKLVLPQKMDEATEFVSGKHSGRSNLFLNPYTGAVQGEIVLQQTDMHKVRKLHGELLMGSFGTKIIELVASWMIVLILTGIYVWWPKNQWRLAGFFTIRTQAGSRRTWRDLHAVTGFWISVLLLITLAGGLPWTDVWGSAFKEVQRLTNRGYPKTWKGRKLQSQENGVPLSLDKMVVQAKTLNWPGKVSIHLPQSAKGVYSVSNRTQDLNQQKIAHFDQYSGQLLVQHDWEEVGSLMRGRQWAMRFHEGLLGNWNWWVMLLMAALFTLSSTAAIFSYVLRKRRGSWSLPVVPAQFQIGRGILVLVVLLGILFPLFGVSLVLIGMFEYGRGFLQRRRQSAKWA